MRRHKRASRNVKGQVWTIEFILSFLIFTAAIILSVKTVFNLYSNQDLRDIQRESEFVSQYLLSEGYPTDWDDSSLIRAGLTTQGRLDISKLERFHSLDYSKAKNALGIRSDFYIYFSNASGNIALFSMVNQSLTVPDGCGFGHANVVVDNQCQFSLEGLRYHDLTKMTRITTFNGSIIELNLIIWR